MDILHEWQLERYAVLDRQGWSNLECQGHSLKLLSSRKFIISSSTRVLESFCLFDSVRWLKCYQKEDSLLLLHRVKDLTRKFRVKFKAVGGMSSQQVCDEVAGVLKRYMAVIDVNNSASTSDNVPAESMVCGEISQQQLFKTVGENRLSLPAAYSTCNYPTNQLETLVRLSITDHNFPAFVAQVEKVLDTVASDL